MAFDENKYKKIFEQRYGAGSFDAGLSSARNIGATRAQAEFAKIEYNQRMKEMERAQKEALKKAEKKTYEDALDFWNDPANKAEARKQGTVRTADNIRNDPRLRAQFKEMGFNVSNESNDFIDALFSAISDGEFRSEREYKQFSSKLNKDTKQKNKARDDEYKSKYGMSYQEHYDFQKKLSKQQQAKQSNKKGFLERFESALPKKKTDNKPDNWFVNAHKFVDKNVVKPVEDKVGRFATDFVDGLSLNQFKKLSNRMDKPQFLEEWTSEPKTKADKVTSFAGQLAGMAAPIGGAYKLTAPLAKPIANAVTKGGKLEDFIRVAGASKGINVNNPAKYVNAAIRGGTAMGAYSTAREGLDEIVNPNDATFKERAARVGLETALGFGGDPAVRALGPLIKNVAGTGLSKITKGEVPTFTGQPSSDVLERLRPSSTASARGQSNELYDRLIFENPSLARLGNKEVPPIAGSIESRMARVLDPKKEVAATSEAIKPLSLDTLRAGGFDATKLKDISGFRAATTDVYRIFKDVYGNRYETQGKPTIDKLDNAKKNYVDMQEIWLGKLKTEVVDKLGIKKGSKESALVQRYGEGNMSLTELKTTAPDKWQNIVEADKWFRQAYNEIYDSVNRTRKEIYPNNSEKHLPKLENYYRHFREMNGLTGLKNIFDSPAQISPQLAGLSQHTNPSSKWHGFLQKRGLGPYKEDAVGGFLEYVPGSSYATHIDRVIPEFKNLRKELADTTESTKNVNNFVEFLYNYSNDLSGKTNPYIDRNLQQFIDISKIDGRKAMATLSWLNNRVKKNVILGNIGSALSQLANIPNGIAFAKQHSVKGMARTISTIVDKNAPMHQSPFLKERYIDGMYRQFEERLIQQPEKMAGWMIETADRIGTSFVWNSAYEKGLKQGVKNPIKYADDNTRDLVAGRGIGEVPLMQKSKAVQLVMPFTLEVANLWHVMRDFAKAKDFGALLTLFAANFMFNRAMEEMRGSAVVFDPGDVLKDVVTEKDLTNTQRAGRFLGEALSNVPIGQHLAGIYPEDGQVFNIKGPTRREVFGDRDPQRFGTGLVAAGWLNDFAFKLALPFGGNQLKKTLNGIEALVDKGEFNKKTMFQVPFVGNAEKLKYPVERNPQNIAKGSLFGPSAFDEAREYYDNKRKPLSENQTEFYKEFERLGSGKEYYTNLMNERTIKTIERKIKEINKDTELTKEEKQKKIIQLFEELQNTQ